MPQITKELLNSGKSKNGAWSEKQLSIFGLTAKKGRGWVKRAIGKEVTDEQVKEFISLKDAHLINRIETKTHGLLINKLLDSQTKVKNEKPYTKGALNRIKNILIKNNLFNGETSIKSLIRAYCKFRNIEAPSIRNKSKWLVHMWLGDGELSKKNSVKPKVKERKKDSRINYEKYLKSAKWKQLRESILLERGLNCEDCKNNFLKYELHVHHLTYVRLFNEQKSDLKVLCVPCHEKAHNRSFSKKRH